MGLCTRCGYLTDDGDESKGIKPEVHNCSKAFVDAAKARVTASEYLITNKAKLDELIATSVKP